MAILGASPIGDLPIAGLPAAAAATDNSIITGTFCDDSILFDYCYDLATDTEEQPEAITKVTIDDTAVVTDNEYTTVLPDAQVDDDLEVLEFLDFARGPPDQENGYVLPSIWPIDEEPVEDDPIDDSIRRILSTPDDETGETTARFVFTDDPDEPWDDTEGFALQAPDQDDQYVLTPAPGADEDVEDFDSSFVMMSPDDAAAVVDATIIVLTTCEDSVVHEACVDIYCGTEEVPDAVQRVTIDDTPVATDDTVIGLTFCEDSVVHEACVDVYCGTEEVPDVWRTPPDQVDDYLVIAQADQADDADEDVDGLLAGPLDDAPVVITDYVTLAQADADDWLDEEDAVAVPAGIIADAVAGLADNEPKPILQADDDDWQAEDNVLTDWVTPPLADTTTVTPPTGGRDDGTGRRRKKRVIPYLETTADVQVPRPVAVQAGERAAPPARLPADHIAQVLFAEPVVPKPVQVTQPVDWAKWDRIQQALKAEAERAAAEAERKAIADLIALAHRRAAEAWFAGALNEVVQHYVAEHAPKGEAMFDEWNRRRKRREQDEERFIILAAMELLK